MDAWETLWKIVLLGGIALFAGMAIWVTIYGAKDIRTLFRELDEQRKNPE